VANQDIQQASIAELLDHAAARAAAGIASLDSGAAGGERDRSLSEALLIHDAGKELLASLSATDTFSGGSGFLVARLNGYFGFHATDAVNVLIRRVLSGTSADSALEWLACLLATESAPGRAIMAVWGVECSVPIDLGHGVSLVPIDSLPDSSARSWVLRALDPSGRSTGLGALWQPPRCALVTARTIAPLLYRASAGNPPPQPDPFRVQDLLNDARLVLTLDGPSHPLPAGHWFEFDDPNLRLAFHSGGISFEHIDIIPLGFEPPRQLDAMRSSELVSSFLGMSDAHRSSLRLSLRRLNQALRRPAHGDRALDLAIALESLLVENAGENTYKLALRAALLLGDTLEDRKRIRALVTALYGLRSTLVHRGELPRTVKVAGVKRPAPEVVTDATAAAAQILSRIVEMQILPDWHSLELGSPGHA
jgi:hypothetical protein